MNGYNTIEQEGIRFTVDLYENAQKTGRSVQEVIYDINDPSFFIRMNNLKQKRKRFEVMSYGSVLIGGGGIVMTSDRFGGHVIKGANKISIIGDNIAICEGTYNTGRGSSVIYKINDKYVDIDVILEEYSLNNSFKYPEQAANSLYDYLSSLDMNKGVIVSLAGYNGNHPEVYIMNIAARQNDYYGDLGFFWNTYQNEYLAEFAKKINSDIEKLNNLSLQEAIEISQFAVDTQRGFIKYLDQLNVITEDIEMVTITPEGAKWHKKSENRKC